MKKFIITIDTEGDNLWDWKQGDPIITENIRYLPRFQKLCNQYGFKPVWLTNYEMISDSSYVEFIAKVEASGTGELGMHLHAWSTPPEYRLKATETGAPYLIEYPVDIMEEKIAVMTETIKNRTGILPVSHRAGRWAMNDIYFRLLKKYGYQVDCSVTPYEDWSGHVGATEGSAGSNYKSYSQKPYWVDADEKLLEVPLTVCKSHRFFMPDAVSPRKLVGSIKRALQGHTIWLRPGHSGEKQIHNLIDRVAASNQDYIMFMLHSSELMPGGSPNFKTAESIEDLYQEMEHIFSHASQKFSGMTLREYYWEFLKP